MKEEELSDGMDRLSESLLHGSLLLGDRELKYDGYSKRYGEFLGKTESGTRMWYWDTQRKIYKERDFSRECAITVAACNFHHTSDTYIKNS